MAPIRSASCGTCCPRELAAVITVVAGVGALAWWARRSLLVVTVDGPSMEPTLHAGDRVLVRRRMSPARGAIVVLAPREDHAGWVIKRVAALPGDRVPDAILAARGLIGRVPPGALVLLGDNPAGVDSRQLGFFARERVLGTVVRRLRPAGER